MDHREALRTKLRATGLRAGVTALAALAAIGFMGLVASPSFALVCQRAGTAVTCDDGRTGIFTGDAIVWPDGTRLSASPHPSVIIGNKPSVSVGPGVFVGQGTGVVPLDDPNGPHKNHCALLDGVSYCQ